MSDFPTVKAYIRPDSSFAFGGNFQLTYSTLDTGTLGGDVKSFVEFSSYVNAISVRRGRTRITDTFESGTCTISCIDTTGFFNPENTSSPIYGYVKPLRQIRVTAQPPDVMTTDPYVVFSGYVQSYTYQYEPGLKLAYVTLECTDAMRLLNLQKITTVTGEAYGESTGARITKILDESVLPSGINDIETGVSVVDNDPGTERDILTAIRQVEETELGAFFFTRNGYARFLSRHTIQKKAYGYGITAVKFDEGTYIGFRSINQNLDDQLLYNDVTVEDAAAVDYNHFDTASINEYFKRSYAKTNTLIITNDEANQHAYWLLQGFKEPYPIVSQITVDMRGIDASEALQVLNLELLDPVTVTKAYANTGDVVNTLSVQSISHTITPARWVVTLGTAEPITGNILGLVLGASTFGVLGSNPLGF